VEDAEAFDTENEARAAYFTEMGKTPGPTW
jgi:hypothetical protein